MKAKKNSNKESFYEKMLKHQKKIMGIISVLIVFSLMLSLIAQFISAFA